MWHRGEDGRGTTIWLIFHSHRAEGGLEIREAALVGAVEGYGRLVDDSAVTYRPCWARFDRNFRSRLLFLCLLDSGVALQSTDVLVATSAVDESSTSCAYGACLCAR